MKASEVLDTLKRRFPNEPEYHQAVSEVLGTIEEVYNEHPEFEKSNLIERLCIPDRIFSFRVTWMDDKGQIQTNMGYRIQHNNAIGPCKGGIRFHASVNLSILKFLAFEQTFKNSLTTLPMGGGKGGSDFSPRGKSNAEIMRFCQAFVLELWRHIGPDTDVPAGDIGVGGREVAYMYGMYKKLARENTGTFTGKGLEFGGSLIRPEATGYGNVYFLLQMLKTRNIDIKGKVVTVSGSGNVAQYTVEKLITLGAKVVTMSDSDGYIYDPDGIDREKLDYIMECVRFAPSAVNFQPWRFRIVTDEAVLKALYSCYKREWLATAPCIIVACVDHNESWHRRADNKDHADIDIAIAVEHLCLAAAEQGLGTCWVCNFDAPQCSEVLGLPENLEPAVLIPVGYAEDEPTEKKRKPLNEILL